MGKIDVIFLLKFGEKHNLDKLLTNGEIFMNTITCFKEMDKLGMGDKYEGAFKIKNIVNASLTFNFPNKPLELKNKDLQLMWSSKEHLGNIYSTYAISTLLLQRKDIHKIDNRMKLFGSHCVIIKDVKGFINAITNKLKELNIENKHNLVKYKNFKLKEHRLTQFHKTHQLSYQKEHRIIAYTDKNEPLKFSIGSIEHYAEIHPTDNIIESLILYIKK